MPDTNDAGTTDAGQTSDTGSTDTGTESKDWAAEATKWRDLARKHEERAKANAKAASELEELRQQSMSDLERAVAQARAEGRAEGLSVGTSRLAAEAIRAAAAGRLSAEQVDALLEVTNLAVFIGEDGDIDRDKINRLVEGMAPPPPAEEDTRHGFPDLGQGARGTAASAALNGDPLLRDIKKKLGIS